MKISDVGLPGLKILEPRVHRDVRGYFLESFRQNVAEEHGIRETFVQDNVSRSRKGVLRGMHYQLPPYGMGKLVRCIRGSVFDAVVDVRSGSPTFGKWFGIVLSDENQLGLYVPPGFAHGFVVLSDSADFTYKCTTYYDPPSERSLRWNDPQVGIQWPMDPDAALLTDKDRRAPTIREIEPYPSR
jgi:dTDP-4-dehydrorhamnose 3,5-epimerase